jgi:hypothetical protein
MAHTVYGSDGLEAVDTRCLVENCGCTNFQLSEENTVADHMDAIVTDIRAKYTAKTRDEYPNGTIIRFKRKGADGKKYTYAVLYANKRWFSTAVSHTNVKSILTTEQLMDVLSGPGVSKVEVATSFESIK